MPARRSLRAFVPLALFGALLAIFGFGIGRDPSVVPSPLIGKPAPKFSAAKLRDPLETISVPADLAGKVWLLNVWASWCSACLAEHAQIQWLSDNNLTVVGLNYKDGSADAQEWLAKHGDPFAFSLVDPDGVIGIDLGVYGVPESFLMDSSGNIIYKHIGPILSRDARAILDMSAAAVAALPPP